MERNLVIIVAYEAEAHIGSVLSRFPQVIWNNPSWEVLCIDDASSDRTALIAEEWRRENRRENLIVLRNRDNQGYGGNQKIGYRYAIDRGFDRVVLIHGDGQYAPERVTGIVTLMKQQNADVYLGARTWSYWSARSGGMPRYKYFGNRVLTFLQNRMTGQSLIEYHTGLRAYSVRFLASLAFDLNSNDFHFDTEILLQAFHSEARIVEQPIEAHYGNEICRVNGPVYALKVFVATLHYWMIRAGFLNSPQYRRPQSQRYLDKTGSRWSSHGIALRKLTAFKPAKVLDIGCGNGFVAQRLKDAGISIHGIDCDDYSKKVKWDSFTRMDLDRDEFRLDVSAFDAVVCLDVIEHLQRPEDFLIAIRNSQKSDTTPVVILCTPNIAFLPVRIALLLGFFNYSDKGILDLDHNRLFTRDSFLRMVRNAGYEVLDTVAVPAPWDFVVPGVAGRFLAALHTIAARIWPSLFAFQVIAVCKPRQNLAVLLAKAERFSDKGSGQAAS
ncbi:MAG: hypothetical protein RIQ81_2096 [Pseudomonadota bacterium]